MKYLILVAIVFSSVGCERKQTATADSVTDSIVRKNEEVREKILALDYGSPDMRDRILQIENVRDEVVREVLAGHLAESFSAAELSELSKIYSSEVMLKLQNLLSSYEYNLEIGTMTQERVAALRS